MLPPPRPGGLGALRALRPADLHRLHGAGAGRLAVPGVHVRGGASARARSRPSPTPARAAPASSARPTRRPSSWPSSPSTWWCSSSSASAPTRSVVDRYAMQPDLVHLQQPVLPGLHRHVAARQLPAHLLQHDRPAHRRARRSRCCWARLRFLALYLIAGLGGSVGSYLLGPHNELGLGASGAIMGVLGAYVVVGLRRHLPVAPVVGAARAELPHRVHAATSTGGPTSAASSPAPSSAFLYDYAGGLRDRTTELALTVGGSVAVLGLLALLHHRRRPGSRRTSVEPRSWLTVRQKSPYCFIGGRGSGTT